MTQMRPMSVMETAQFSEFCMLFAFGFSWPFAIHRTYRAKRVDGKSPAFMMIVLLGYVGGICARLLDSIAENDWLAFVYALDMTLGSTELKVDLKYRNKARANQA